MDRSKCKTEKKEDNGCNHPRKLLAAKKLLGNTLCRLNVGELLHRANAGHTTHPGTTRLVLESSQVPRHLGDRLASIPYVFCHAVKNDYIQFRIHVRLQG